MSNFKEPLPELAAAVLKGDRRAAARLISRAEAADDRIAPDLRALYLAGGHARVIGITGPPGAGKSTIIDQMITLLRTTGQRIAVLAVDPSSPFSGGAVLGDRLRMNRHAEDQEVLIRSMATHGTLGGLAPAAGDAVTVLDAMRFDTILIETVGVGQNEVDILSLADAVILLQTAHSGDGVQMVKAGTLEIADLLVVNKAETPGSEKMAQVLREMLAHATVQDGGWIPAVIEIEAIKGAGASALMQALEAFFAHRKAHPGADMARRKRQVRAHVLALTEVLLRRRLFFHQDESLDVEIDAVITRLNDPHSLAQSLAEGKSPQS